MTEHRISDINKLFHDQIYTGSLSARMIHPDGRPYHTFRTSSLLVDGSHLTFTNCTFENPAGKGKEVGQAIALYIDGDDIHCINCQILGHQDTLFLAPLPEKEREVDGFLGPKQFEPRAMHKYYFKNCLITGGVDFVFGGGEAVFEDCEFRSIEPGFVFAPNTPSGEKGFMVKHCRFTCSEDVPDGSCYLGRPWRDHARVTIEDCFLDRHIHPDGWIGWNRSQPESTTQFREIRSYGPGANDGHRPDWVIQK